MNTIEPNRYMKNVETGMILAYDSNAMRFMSELHECDENGVLIGRDMSQYSDVLYKKFDELKKKAEELEAENALLKGQIAKLNMQIEDNNPLSKVRCEFSNTETKDIYPILLKLGYKVDAMRKKTRDQLLQMIVDAREKASYDAGTEAEAKTISGEEVETKNVKISE